MENVAKVVPNRIFSLAVHPSTEKLLVAAGGKWGNVGLWDVRDNTSTNHGVQLFKVSWYYVVEVGSTFTKADHLYLHEIFFTRDTFIRDTSLDFRSLI